MAQRFGVVTFDAPPGWSQEALGDGLMFEVRPAGTRTFCQMFLRTSRKTATSLSLEMERTWSELRRTDALMAAGPDPAHRELPGGLTLAQRVGRVKTDTGTLVKIINLFQKDDRLVSVTVNIPDLAALERCTPAVDEFLASVRIDATPTDAASPVPRSDPALAAKFGNSVVGTWRYAITTVDVTLNAPSQIRNAIEVQFAPEGTYRITINMTALPGGGFNDAESGTYQVEGQRIVMRPRQTGGKPESYALDWFFGDHPSFPGNWGLILRSSLGSPWPGSFSGLPTAWRTFKPAG